MLGEHVNKLKNGIQVHILIQKILKVNIQLKSETCLLGLMDKQILINFNAD